ncbi:MAG: serine/threonine protein kinase [Planctomycetes bacterium]|nr:serine/threonine protein kinase [Planctomycetota bacterium]HNZ65819.1 serine/threonine-protein kinase [Planctomycetota bacterium]HPY73890.1 serine/threonine-protein kinase [Planctomycetota bacterium]HQA99408.1 serine/threonine-protein kinase [Planctomycetota bacterium]
MKLFSIFQRQNKTKKINDDWEEIDFLDISCTDTLKKKCIEVFGEEAVEEFDHYTIQEEIGRGKMGIVYKAFHNQDKQTYALKIMPKEVIHEQKAMERFFQEIRILHSLSHENIVGFHKIGVCDETIFIVMEYVQGTDLDKFLRKKAPLTEQHSLKLLIPILEALVHAYSRHIVHLDLKPANILLVANTEQPKIGDFGLAKFSTEDNNEQTFGTPAYMSPEQILQKKLDIRADIYAVGSILYQMLSGNRPFYHLETPSLLLKVKTEEEAQDIQDLVPDITPSLRDMVTKAVAREPKKRYQTPNAFLATAQLVQQEILQKKTQTRYVPKALEELHKNATSSTFKPKQEESIIMMTASRYEIDEVLQTFEREIKDFQTTPVGNALVEESRRGMDEFEETLISITKVTGAMLPLSDQLAKKILTILNTPDLMKSISAVLGTNITEEEKNTLQELKYFILLRGNALTKNSETLNIINKGKGYLRSKLQEFSNITINKNFNEKIKKYLEYLVDNVLKAYHDIFIDELRNCKDKDEAECYLQSYNIEDDYALKVNKRLNIIKKTKDLQKAINKNPKNLEKALSTYLGNKPTTLHESFRKWHQEQETDTTLYNAIQRTRNIEELIAHLIRLEKKEELRSITSRFHDLLNAFIGSGGQSSLTQFKTGINFLPAKEVNKVGQILTRYLKRELEQRIQELLMQEGDEHRRYNALITTLRNPRYHEGITLYGYSIKDLLVKIMEIRANTDQNNIQEMQEQIPTELIQLIHQDLISERASSVKNVDNCILRLKQIQSTPKTKQGMNIIKELVELFKYYGKINFAREDSIYAIDGYEVARSIVQYFNNRGKKELKLPEKIREDIAKILQQIIQS